MLVSLKWLRDYVDIDMDVKEFADKMTMTGTKVETIDYYGEEIENILVGKILEIKQHPNADKLVVTTSDDNLIKDMKKNTENLGKIYDKEDKAKKINKDLDRKISDMKDKTLIVHLR